MSPIQYLEADFDRLGFSPDSYTEENRRWLADEGEVPDFAVQLKDKSLEFILNSARVVTTVFVRNESDIEQLLGVQRSDQMTEAVTKILGRPDTSGSETSVPILGKKGAWLRYDYPKYSMHIQKAVGVDAVEMVTLMVRDE